MLWLITMVNYLTLLNLVIVSGDPLKMAMVTAETSLTPNVGKVADNLTALLPRLSVGII